MFKCSSFWLINFWYLLPFQIHRKKSFILWTFLDSLDSLPLDSDVFYVERSPEEESSSQNNTPVVLNSTQLSGGLARKVIRISSVASLQPQIVPIKLDFNELTIPYGYGKQVPIIPPSLKDLTLPLNPLNAMTPISPAPITEAQLHHVEIAPCTLQKEVIIVTDISMPSMLVSSIRPWKKFHTWGHSILTNPDESPLLRAQPPRHRLHNEEKENWPWECFFLKRLNLAAHLQRSAVNPYLHKEHPKDQNKFEQYYFQSDSKFLIYNCHTYIYI